MKILKIVLTLFFVVPAAFYTYKYVMNANQMQFESICQKDNKKYTTLCENVGKYAWTQKSVSVVNEKNYGKIIGVAWRKKDSIISSSSQKKKRRSEKNAYYYIIGNAKDFDSQFLIRASEIDPSDNKK